MVIAIAIAGLIIVLFVMMASMGGGRDIAQKPEDPCGAFNSNHAGWDTHFIPGEVRKAVSPEGKKFLYTEHQVIAVAPDGSQVAFGEVSAPAVYSSSAIVSVEALQDEATLTQTNRASQAAGALIGGMALGGVGLIVGGLSGSQRSAKRVHSLKLKVIVADRTSPVHVIDFFTSQSGEDPKSRLVEEAFRNLERFHALLLLGMRDSEKAASGALQSDGPPTRPEASNSAVRET